MPSSSSLVGKQAPDFTIPDSNGQSFTLSSVVGKGKPVALFFFPKAGTPVCDAEACAFEKVYKGGEKTLTVGVSYNPPAELAAWKEKHNLSYPVLSDEKRVARDAYHIGKLLFGASEQRSTFFIDGEGKVLGVLDGTMALLTSEKHVKFIQEWEAKTTKA